MPVRGWGRGAGAGWFRRRRGKWSGGGGQLVGEGHRAPDAQRLATSELPFHSARARSSGAPRGWPGIGRSSGCWRSPGPRHPGRGVRARARRHPKGVERGRARHLPGGPLSGLRRLGVTLRNLAPVSTRSGSPPCCRSSTAAWLSPGCPRTCWPHSLTRESSSHHRRKRRSGFTARRYRWDRDPDHLASERDPRLDELRLRTAGRPGAARQLRSLTDHLQHQAAHVGEALSRAVRTRPLPNLAPRAPRAPVCRFTLTLTCPIPRQSLRRSGADGEWPTGAPADTHHTSSRV